KHKRSQHSILHDALPILNKEEHDIIDDDLYEDLDEEKMNELVEEARIEALLRAQREKEQSKPKRPFPKWPFWLISIALLFNVFADRKSTRLNSSHVSISY